MVQTQKHKAEQEICVENQVEIKSIDHFKLCYLNNRQDQFTLVWFVIESSLNATFDFYRFVLRSDDESSSARPTTEILTNFTGLIDFNNSLRMLNLDTGEYEVCIEFKSDSPAFVYQPRDGCIIIEVGTSRHSFKQSLTPLLIALASGIVIFFILGLVVQWGKNKRQKRLQDEMNEPRRRSSSVFSATALKQQRDRLIQNFVQRYIDEPRSSRMHQWALNRAFRHRIDTPEQELFERPNFFRKWSRNLLLSGDQSPPSRPRRSSNSHSQIPVFAPVQTTNNIFTLSGREHQQAAPRKFSFHLSPPEEFQMV